MNRRTLGIIFMALMILGIAIPFTTINTITYATITGRPTIVYNGSALSQLQIPVNATITLNFTGMTISGAQIWIWFSTDGSAVITPSDVWYIGPIYVYQIFLQNARTTSVPVSGTFGGGTIKVSLGKGVVNFTIPTLFESSKGGKKVVYWIKVTDVNPSLRPNIPSSDVAVSTNNFTVKPIFELDTANKQQPYVVPKEPVTIWGYATAIDQEYDITYNSTEANIPPTLVATVVSQVNTIPPQDNNPEWNWTGFKYTFPIKDLGLTPGNTPTSIEVNVNQTGNILANWTLKEKVRNVTVAGETVSSNPYTITTKTFEILDRLDITVENFVYEGSLTITLSNSTLNYVTTLASNVQLDKYGSCTNLTVTIPVNIPRTSYYWLNITDGDVTVSVQIYVKIVPYLTVEPLSGYVGSEVNVTLHRFNDYRNQRITLIFVRSTSPSGCPNVTVANFTVEEDTMNVTITIPEASYGLHYIYAADVNGVKLSDVQPANFTVLAKVVVEPSVIPEGQEFLTINATGLNTTGYYDILLDQGALLWGFKASPCGSLQVTIPATGLKPGLHVVAVYYESWSTPNVTVPDLYATFTVVGPTLEDVLDAVNGLSTQLNDVVVGINDLKALITSLGDDITLKLQSINNTLATLIVEKNNEVIAKVCTKLNELNATIVSISKNGLIELKTALGDIQTSLQALKSSNAELKDLIVTKSGEIKGVIETTAGNITASLNALEQLIKSGLKVDTQTLLSKIDEIKSQLSNINGSVSTVSSKLDQLASTLDNLKSMLSNVQSAVSNVQSTVTDIKSSLQDIKNTVSSLASKIESTASSIKSYINSQNSDLKKAVEGISGTVSTYGIISIILIIIAIAVSGYGVYKKKE